MTTQDCLLWPE